MGQVISDLFYVCPLFLAMTRTNTRKTGIAMKYWLKHIVSRITMLTGPLLQDNVCQSSRWQGHESSWEYIPDSLITFVTIAAP